MANTNIGFGSGSSIGSGGFNSGSQNNFGGGGSFGSNGQASFGSNNQSNTSSFGSGGSLSVGGSGSNNQAQTSAGSIKDGANANSGLMSSFGSEASTASSDATTSKLDSGKISDTKDAKFEAKQVKETDDAVGGSAIPVEEEERNRRREELKNQLSKPLPSSVYRVPDTKYTKNGRISFPSEKTTKAGQDYPVSAPGESKQIMRERMEKWDPDRSKRNDIEKEQASVVIDDLLKRGVPPVVARDIVEENRRLNESGALNNRMNNPESEAKRQAVRSHQYDAVQREMQNRRKEFLDNGGYSHISDAFDLSGINQDDLFKEIYGEFGEFAGNDVDALADFIGRYMASEELKRMDREDAERKLAEERNKKNPPKPKTAEEAEQEARENLKKEYIGIEANKAWLSDMLLDVKEGGGYNPKTGRCEFSEKTLASLNLVGSLYGLDPTNFEDFATISMLIKYCSGLGCDKEGKIFGDKYEDFKMSEYSIRQACWLIVSSQQANGHPFGLSVANSQIQWGGKNRYPVGCIPMSLAERLVENENSVLHSMTASELQNTAMRAWVDSVQPTLAKHCASTGDDSLYEQWASIEHMIMATCEMTGMDSNKWNVSPYSDRRLSSCSRASNGLVEYEQDVDAINVHVDRTLRGANTYIYKQGKLANRSNPVKTADFLFSKGGSVIRGARIMLEVPLAASAEFEHLINNTEIKFINKMLFSSPRGNGDEFIPTKAMHDIAESNKFLETYAALSALFDAGGWDAVEAFRASGQPATEASIKAWVAQNSYSYEPKGKLGKKFSNLADAANKAFEIWMPGDFGFAKPDAKLFIDCFMAEQCRRNGIPAKEIERVMAANPGQFIADALGTTVGKDAYVSTKALYAGRISPLPEIIKAQLKRNGFGDFVVASIMESWYVQYGMKAFELWMPFSNTLSLLAAKGINIKSTGEGGKGKYIDIMETTVGGSSEDFSDAINKALIYDCVKLGQNTLQAFFIAALIGLCGGMEPPEDDEGNIDMSKFYLPWEWTIQFPWMSQRLPLKQIWWMDDILQGSAIAAVAMCFMTQAREKDYPIEESISLAAGRMFMNGITDVMGNNQVFEVLSIVADLIGCGRDIWRYVSNEDLDLNDYISEFADGVAGRFSSEHLVEKIAKAFNSSTPMILTEIYPWFWNDDYERNYFQNIDGTMKSKQQAAWNKYAVNNPFVAWVGNIASAIMGQGFFQFGRDNSNFQYRPDKTAEAYVQNNSYDKYCADWCLSDTEDAQAAYAEWILEKIESVGGAENAMENGIMLEYGDYKKVRDYLNAQVSSLFDDIADVNAAYFNGAISKADKYRQNDYYYSQYYRLKDQLNSFEYNDLVYEKDAYIEVAGTYVQNPETGEWYNYGDKKGENTFLPFYSPQGKTPGDDYMSQHWGTEIGNGFQTNSYMDQSDSSQDMLTSGARNLVANKENRNVQSVMEETADLIAKWDEAIAALKEQGNGSGGSSGGYASYRSSSYRYSGGSGRGYTPNISSYSRDMNAPKAATMYSKTPYSTSTKYLSPTVYTSGSRSPYSRRES